MIIAIPVTEDGQIDPRWGKAREVAIAEMTGTDIASWTEHSVGWDDLHDQGAHGTHHARIVRFLRDNGVEAVVINHCGASMMNTMQKMGLIIVDGAAGPAKDMAVAAAAAIQREREERR